MKDVIQLFRASVIFCSLHTVFWLSLSADTAHGGEFIDVQKGSIEQAGYSVTAETAPFEMLSQITATGTASGIPTGPRYRAAGTSCDGKTFYVMGGADDLGSLLNEAWRYRPADNTWTRLADLPIPLMNFEAACIDGVIYLVGGYNLVSHTNNFQLYDVATDSWTATTWPNSRTPMTAVYNGLLYTVGGNPGPSNETWVYDPKADNWQRLADMPTANSYGAATTVGNHIFQIGGGLTNTVQRYDPKSNTWDNSGPQLQDSRMSALVAWYGKYIYVVSGGGIGGDFWTGWPTIEIYDYSRWPAGSWSYDDDAVPSPFVGAAGDCTANSIWAAGGTSGFSTMATNQYVDDNMRCHFPFPWPMFLPAITTGEASAPPPLVPGTVTGLWALYRTPDSSSVEKPPIFLELHENNGSISGYWLCTNPDELQSVSGNIVGQDVTIYISYFRYGVVFHGTINGLQMSGTYNDGTIFDPTSGGTWRATKISDVTCQ